MDVAATARRRGPGEGNEVSMDRRMQDGMRAAGKAAETNVGTGAGAQEATGRRDAAEAPTPVVRARSAGEEPPAASSPLSAASDRDVLNFFIIVLGFGLCRAWIVFCLGAPLVAPAAVPTHWIYLACGAACSLAIALACRRAERLAPVSRVLFCIVPPALLASGALIALSLFAASEPLMALGFVIGGIGAGALQVLWGDRFARHSVEFAAFASPAAAIVTAVAAALSTSQTGFMGFVAVPLLSFALLVFHAGRGERSWRALWGRPEADALGLRDGAGALAGAPSSEAEAARAEASATSATLSAGATENAMGSAADDAAQTADELRRSRMPLGMGKLMFSIMTFSLLCRTFDTMPPHDDPLAFLGGSAVFSLVVVGVAFFTIAAKVRERFNPTFIYRLSLPIMVAGFVAIALLFDTHAAVSILIINVGYEFFDILTWVLFVDAAHCRRGGGLYVFGLGVAFMFAGMAVGNVTSHIVDMLVADGSMQANVVAMAAILCLVIVAFLVLPEGTLTQLTVSLREDRREHEAEGRRGAEEGDGEPSTAEETSEAALGRIEQHCIRVARDFGLTPRESEVIVLLAYGRTLSVIARDLHIAQGTARTHIENIYRKLDVHKQQELIDLVERHGE